MEENLGSTSHKGEKIKSYTVDYKLEAIAFAKPCNNKAAARKFNVAPKTIRDWIRKEEQLHQLKQNKAYGGKRLCLEGGGQHAFDDDLEDELVQWITERRGNELCVSTKLTQLKAKKMHEEKTINDLNSKTINFSDGWVQMFMRRHGLSIRRRTTEAQKNPSQLIDKLCTYIMKVRKLRQRMNYDMKYIIAMDETAV